MDNKSKSRIYVLIMRPAMDKKTGQKENLILQLLE
jgi:hypothetical protein